MTYTVIPSRAPMSGLGQPPGASTRPPRCSDQPDYKALQTMLRDLGYYSGPIDGTMSTGGPTQNAAVKFGQDEGFDMRFGIEGPYCERILQRWMEKMVEPQDLPRTDRPMPKEFYQNIRRMAVAPKPAEQQQMDQSYEGSLFDDAGSGGGALAKTKSWWSEQSMVTKVAIVGGGVAVTGGIIYAVTR